MFSVEKALFGNKNTDPIIVFAGPNIKMWQIWLLGQLLSSYHFKTLIFTWEKDPLGMDSKESAQHFEEIKSEALNEISKLPKRQQKHLKLLTLHQGIVPGLLLASNLPKIEKVVINLAGADLAEIVWSWDKINPRIKKALLKQKITLPKLKEQWKEISPITHINSIKSAQILYFLAEHDEYIPFTQQKMFLEALREQGTKVDAIINTRHPHFLSGLINMLRFPIYISFLKGK